MIYLKIFAKKVSMIFCIVYILKDKAVIRKIFTE